MEKKRTENSGVMRNPGDWLATASLITYAVSLFALSWLSVGIDLKIMGRSIAKRDIKTIGFLDIPRYWLVLMIIGAVLVVFGLFYRRTRGALSIGVGVYFLIFSVVFYFGAWYKIRAVVGDLVEAVRSLPLVGSFLGALVNEITKNVLVVRFTSGYFLFIATGVLLLAGGLMRLFVPRVGEMDGSSALEVPSDE